MVVLEHVRGQLGCLGLVGAFRTYERTVGVSRIVGASRTCERTVGIPRTSWDVKNM